MDFEKIYQKFLDGTATPEEVEFVRGEMKKANDINTVLQQVKSEGATRTADRETVKKAVKMYKKKDTLKILTVVFCTLLLIGIGIGCAIGIPVIRHAKDNTKYSVEQAEQIALDYLAEVYPTHTSDMEVYRVEKELEVEGRLKNAHYIYVFDIYNGFGGVVEIEIDSKTGHVIDVDAD